MVPDQLLLHVTVFTVIRQAIEARDELPNRFVFLLCSAVKPHALKNNVLPNLEVGIKFCKDIVILFLLSIEMFVDIKTSSASSPKQYKSVLTCLSSSSLDNPDAMQNCSNLCHHLGHSSGVSNQKAEEVEVMLGILLW